MWLKQISGILILFGIATVAFATCIDQVRNVKTREYCEDYYACDDDPKPDPEDWWLRNCCGNWQEEESEWTDCVEDCEPGTCEHWTGHGRAGSFTCRRSICIKTSPKTSLCDDYECSDQSKVDEYYSTCTDPVCNKGNSFGNTSRIYRESPRFASY